MGNSLKYDKLIIYYFSGTGNARNAAGWIIKTAEDRGIETQLINIDRLTKIATPELNGNTLIGFCSPTHGFNLPPIALKFVQKFPKLKNTDVFILNTRGGLKLHKLFIPGLSGLAQIFPALILRLKGFRVVGMQPMDLPSNWLILHPGLKQNVIDSIYERCRKITEKFSSKMLSGQKSYKALLSLPFDIAITPIALGYYFIGRFFLAKTLIATDACNRCDKCIHQCPVEAISVVNKMPFWSYKCESCMRCVNACPQRAIETTHGFAITMGLLSVFVNTPILILLMNKIGAWEFIQQSEISKNIWTLISGFIFVLFVFLSYRLLHFMMRYTFFNKLIAYTSLSTYKFWRRYKAPTQT